MQPNERCACYTTPRTPGWRLEWERHRRQVELTRNALCVAAWRAELLLRQPQP